MHLPPLIRTIVLPNDYTFHIVLISISDSSFGISPGDMNMAYLMVSVQALLTVSYVH